MNHGSVSYGVVFRVNEAAIGRDFYLFSINELGGFSLNLYKGEQWKSIVEWENSSSIKHLDPSDDLGGEQGDWHPTNSIVVEARREKITLGINGKLLSVARDNNLSEGYAGLFVASIFDFEDDFARDHGFTDIVSRVDVRFKNFRLYSLEN